MYPIILTIVVSWQRQHENGTFRTIQVLTQNIRFTEPPEHHVRTPLGGRTSADEPLDPTRSILRASTDELDAMVLHSAIDPETDLEK